MKRLHPPEKIFMMCVVVLASTVLLVTKIDAQNQATPNPTPLSGEAAWVFPTTLFCEDIGSYENGPKWEDIQIGESQLNDLIKKIELFSEDFTLVMNDPTSESFAIYNIVDNVDHLAPTTIFGCVRDDVVTAIQLDLGLSTNGHNLYLDDLVEIYDIPDTVTYSSGNPFSHVVFWFEEGIAANVYTPTNDTTYEPSIGSPSYGVVTLITYFPYQSRQGYGDRWPFSKTFGENPYRPEPVGTENPYNFDEMIATFTAEPSRTPTPTFTPIATATPDELSIEGAFALEHRPAPLSH